LPAGQENVTDLNKLNIDEDDDDDDPYSMKQAVRSKTKKIPLDTDPDRDN